MFKKRKWIILLLAAVVVFVLTGCSKSQKVGIRSVSSTEDMIKAMNEDLTFTQDGQLDSGTAAAATYLIKNRYQPTREGEETGLLAAEMRSVSNTESYNYLKTPTAAGTTRMSRLFVYPGEWSEKEVAWSISNTLWEMDEELADKKEVGIAGESCMTYTYTYSVNVRQVYSDQVSAWVVGVGVTQTAKEIHTT